MKTKTLITAILLFTMAVNTYSQEEYHPFLNNSAWTIRDWVSCCKTFPIQTIEEGTNEVIGSKTYKKFIDPRATYGISVVYLREDIIGKKVYKFVNGADVLLYDFSLETGDTIPYAGDTFIAAVDNIAVNGGSRKRITLKSIELYCKKSVTMRWIEGVGTNKHPFYPEWNIKNVCSTGGGLDVFTVCSFQNGIQVYGTPGCVIP